MNVLSYITQHVNINSATSVTDSVEFVQTHNTTKMHVPSLNTKPPTHLLSVYSLWSILSLSHLYSPTNLLEEFRL